MENNKIKVIIADENDEQRTKLKNDLQFCDFLEVIADVKSGKECLSKIKEKNPELVILDIVLSGIDGFSVIEEAKKLNLNTKFVLMTSFAQDNFISKATSLNVAYYILKPYDKSILIKRLHEIFIPEKSANIQLNNSNLLQKQQNNIVNAKKFDEKITNIFITVGIPAHIKGYYFLREAIKLAIDDPDIINSITKKLYPSIAGRFETSASKVERAIRHAIEVAWNRGKIENINSVFGLNVYSSNEKPTNGEFIALVADKMLLEC